MAAADGLLDFARRFEGTSDYAQNLRTIAGVDHTYGKHIAILVSVIAAKNKADAKAKAEAERATLPQANEFIGAVGGKVKDLEVTITGCRLFDGDYGLKTLITMRDADGRELKWWATGDKMMDEGKRHLKGATIKKHEEYRGVKQTIVKLARFA